MLGHENDPNCALSGQMTYWQRELAGEPEDTWNGVGALVFGATIPELFAAQVARTPDAPALEDNNETLTYRQLDTRANNLAHRLQTHGAQPETILAVALPRSIQLITTLLAITKTGAAYLPIDPNYPSERTHYILTDATPQLLITDTTTTTALPHTNTPHLTLDTDTDTDTDTTTNPKTDLQPDNLAFLVYTSGSTGHPKAVMVTHRGVTNLVNQATKTLPIAGQRVMASTSVAFAFSAFEIFTPLSHGGCIEIAPNALTLSHNNAWTAQIISTVPSAFTEILKALNTPTNHQTKIVVLGGETLPPKLLHQTHNKLPGLTVINSYGSTETLCATLHPLTNHQPTTTQHNNPSVPIGSPLHNTQMFVLDTQLTPTPIGTTGELYIAGAGLARGYRNQTQLTAQRFIACPFGPAGTRMYRTGDIARWTPNGVLEYIGRTDDRIKIHGFRIEPGEIEATLTNHPHIAQAAVTTHTPTHNNADTTDKQLIAYVVPEPNTPTTTTQLTTELRQYAATHLPHYMVPAAITLIEALPLTPNGKLNRQALPTPQFTTTTTYRPPRNHHEQTLATLFAETLGLPHIGIDDNFFELGGHSLTATRLITRIRTELNTEIPLRTIFTTPTITGLTNWLSQEHPPEPEDPFGVVLPIRVGGTKPPMWCIHPAGGICWSYRGFINNFHDRSIYGLQARGLDPTTPVAASLQSMINDYLEQILIVQQEGPFFLLGWSFGGVVAHAIGAELQRRGHEVGLLALIASAAPCEDNPTTPLQVPPESAIFNKGCEWLRERFDISIDNHEHESIVKTVVAIAQNNLEILRDFVSPIYSGPAVIFIPTIGESKSREESIAEWVPYLKGTVSAHDVEGTHDDMDLPEPMARIGQILDRELR